MRFYKLKGFLLLLIVTLPATAVRSAEDPAPPLLAFRSQPASTAKEAAGWKAGTGRVVITPHTPMPMAGYASRGAKPAEGALNDLWAKVLIIQDPAGKQAALITLDLIGIDRKLSQQICDELIQKYGWDRSRIAICTSHTHSGPVVGETLAPISLASLGDAEQKQVQDYSKFLRQSVTQAVAQAVEQMKPAQLFWGNGTATFAVNRRANREADVPRLRADGALRGPFDHDVPVLTVKDQDKIVAVVFGYACHNTVLSGFQWSGDYAGLAQSEIERRSPGCQAMFWSGCGGDQNPIPRREVPLAQKYGAELADAVIKVTSSAMTPLTGKLATAYQEVDLQLASLPSMEEIQKNAQSANQYEAARAKMLLSQIENNGSLSQTYPYPIGVWKLGNEVTFVHLGGEVVVDYALRLKSELAGNRDPSQIWVAGYTNDVMAYIPSRRVLLEGGYEGGASMVYYGLPTVWAPEVEETIVSSVQLLAKKLPSQTGEK